MNYFDLSAGMEINIAVRCQCCDDGYLNTPARIPERARECAESMGWVWHCGIKHMWICPECWTEIKSTGDAHADT